MYSIPGNSTSSFWSDWTKTKPGGYRVDVYDRQGSLVKRLVLDTSPYLVQGESLFAYGNNEDDDWTIVKYEMKW